MSKNAKPFRPDNSAETETKFFEYKTRSLSSTKKKKKSFGPSAETSFDNIIEQCFLNWVLRNPRVPQMGVRGSKRRKCVRSEEFYWRS